MRAACLLLLFSCVACIKAPEIVMVDRATALEQQASASFDQIERDVSVSALTARPLPLTPNQLKALGIMPAPIIDQSEQSEADRIDALLRQRCVGEGKDGLLIDTHDDCIGAADRALALTLIDRTNRARVQLWQWLEKERPDASPESLREGWRIHHGRGVVCQGWVQNPDGSWGAKPC